MALEDDHRMETKNFKLGLRIYILGHALGIRDLLGAANGVKLE